MFSQERMIQNIFKTFKNEFKSILELLEHLKANFKITF